MEKRLMLLNGKVDSMDSIIVNGNLAIGKVGNDDIYFNFSSAGCLAKSYLLELGANIENEKVFLSGEYLGQVLNISEHFNKKNDLYRFFQEKEKTKFGTATYPVYKVENGYISKEGGAVKFINNQLLQDVTMKDLVGKNIQPDDMYFDESTNILHIIEKKHSMTIQGNAFERSAALPLFWSIIAEVLEEKGIKIQITYIFCKVATEWKTLKSLLRVLQKQGHNVLIDSSKVDEISLIKLDDYKF